MLYFRQRVAVTYNSRKEWRNVVLDPMHIIYLVLTPLSSLTDADAVEACQLMFGFSFRVTHHDDVYVELESDGGTQVNINMADGFIAHSEGDDVLGNPSIVSAYDYLRSRGYILPFSGLTPDQILDRKWAIHE